MAIFDFHTHVFAKDVVARREDFLKQDAAFRELYSNPRATIATTSDIIDAMDRAGITQAVVCGFGWLSAALCTDGNDAIIAAVQRHPDRLIGFGTIAPNASLTDSLSEIDRLASAGLRGLGELRPDIQGLFDLPSADLEALAERLRERQLVLLLHASEPVGHFYPGKGISTPDRLMSLLSHFTGVPVVLAHAGGGLPFYAFMPEVKQALANVYVDTAALPFLYRPEALRAIIAALGADHILFGSDYPLIPYDRMLAYLDQAGLTALERNAVLSGNATHLLTEGSRPAWKPVPSPTT